MTIINSNALTTSHRKIMDLFDHLYIKASRYTIHANGSVDILGDFDLTIDNWNNFLPDLKHMPFQFQHVSGDFFLPEGITSLIGCPYRVDGEFNISNTRVTSLEYCPKQVGLFDMRGLRTVKSFAHAPLMVEGSFSCIECGVDNPMEYVYFLKNYIGGTVYLSRWFGDIQDALNVYHKSSRANSDKLKVLEVIKDSARHFNDS